MTRNLLTLALFATIAVGCQQQPRTAATAPKAAPALRAGAVAATPYFPMLRGNPQFDVRKFGAKGDGITNDTTAIQNATTAAAAVRGEVFFPPGTFLISSTITSTAPVAWVGSGTGDETGTYKAATIIKKSADVLAFKVMGSYSRIEKLCIYTALAGTSDGIWIGDADNTNGANHVVLRNINVIGMRGHGIWARNGNSGRLDNVRVVGAAGNGVHLHSMQTAATNVNDWCLTAVQSLSCGGDGIAVSKAIKTGLFQCRGESNTGYGLFTNSAYTNGIFYSEGNTAGYVHVGVSAFSGRMTVYRLPGATALIENNGNVIDVQDGSGVEMSQLITGVRLFNAAVVRKRVVLTYSGFVSPSMVLGNTFDLTPTNGTAFTMGNPSGGTDGDEITFTIFNTTGGALGALTWSANYKLVGSAWTQPATGFNRSVSFRRSGTLYYETARSSGDVPN
jgi:hypothetical protein